jgi:hypothetical protein
MAEPIFKLSDTTSDKFQAAPDTTPYALPPELRPKTPIDNSRKVGDFVPASYSKIGSPENHELIHRLNSTQEGVSFLQTASQALQEKTDYDNQVRSYNERMAPALKQVNTPSFGKIPGGLPAANVMNSLPGGEDPSAVTPRSAYGQFLTAHGDTPANIVTSIINNQDKAKHISDRIAATPEYQSLIETDPTLLDRPDELLAELKRNKLFNNPDEITFTQEGYKSQFGTRAAISPIQNLRDASPNYDKTKDKEARYNAFMSHQLVFNPNDPRDRAELKSLLDWRDKTNPGPSPMQRFADTIMGLGHAIGNAAYGAVATVGHPAINYSDSFTDEKAKENLNATVLQIKKLREQGADMTGWSMSELEDMVARHQERVGSSDNDMTIPARAMQDSHELIVKATAQYEDIRRRGGFSGFGEYIPIPGGKQIGGGVQSALTLASAATTAFLPIMSQVFMNDVPGQTIYSPITTAKNNLSALVNALEGPEGNDNTWTNFWGSDGLYERCLYQSIISNMNTAGSVNEWANDRTKYGWLPNGMGIDTSWHRDASMFVTPQLLLGGLTGLKNLGVNVAADQTMFPSLSKTAIGAQNASARVAIDASRKAMLASLEDLKNQGALDKIKDPAAVSLIQQVKDAAKNAGEGDISDVEVIKRAFSGDAKMPDPADPSKLIPIPPTALKGLAESINEHVGTVKELAEKIETARIASLGINYSSRSMETINKMREALKVSEPNIDWDKMNDASIYTRIQRGRIPSSPNGVAAITTNEARAIQQEVGDQFRRIDTKDLDGFNQGQALPISTGYIGRTLGWTLNGISKTLQNSRDAQRWIAAGMAEHGDPSLIPLAVNRVGLLSGESVSATGLDAAGQSLISGVMKAKGIGFFARTFGSVGDATEVFNDFISKNNLASGQEFGSTLRGMQRDYFERMNQLKIKRVAITQSHAEWVAGAEERALRGEIVVTDMPEGIGTSVPFSELKKIDVEYQNLSDKSKLVARLDWAGRNGMISDLTRMMANGTISCTSNEMFMAWVTDFNSLGAGTAYGMFGTGIDALHQGFSRQFTTTGSLRARTNQSLIELQGIGAALGPGEASDIQRMNHLKLQMQERDKANIISAKEGQLAGEVYFARSMSIMSALFKSGADVQFNHPDVIQGAMSLMRQVNFAEPENASGLLKQYLKEANSKGLTGTDATGYAQEMVNTWISAQHASIAAGEIQKSIDALRVEQAKISLGNGDMLNQRSQVCDLLAKDLGLDPSKLFDVNGNLSGGLDLSKLDPKVRHKVETFIETAKDIKEKNSAAVARQAEIDNQVAELKAKKDALPKSEFAQFREGESIYNESTDERWTSVKNGVTIFEKGGKTTIMMPNDKWDPETAQEEFAHVLIRTTNARDSLPEIRNKLLGKISVDSLGKRIQIAKPSIAETPEEGLKLMDKFVNAHSETLSIGDSLAFRGQWELAKAAFAKNPNDISRMDSVLLEITAKIYQAQQALSNPHQLKFARTPGSPSGALESTSIITPEGDRGGDIGLKGVAKMFVKIGMGDLTVADLVNDGRPINSLVHDLKPGVTEADVLNGIRFLKFFGKNGDLAKFMDSMTINKLRDMGFEWSPYASGGAIENPKDYNKFWTYGKIRDPNTGELIDMHPDLISWAKQLQIHTRNIGGEVSPYAPWDVADIVARADSTDAADTQARWQWALSSGRAKWINPITGKFTKLPEILFSNEQKPMKLLADKIIGKEVGFDNETIGLYPKESPDGGVRLFGSPNKAQVKKIMEFLSSETAKSDGNLQTLETVRTLLTAIAAGNIFDPTMPKGQKGFTSVFWADYNAASESLGYNTPKRKASPGLDTRQVLVVPLSVELRQSGLNTEGRKATPEEIERYGKTQLYVHMLDVNALNMRVYHAWHGLLTDRNGDRYWAAKGMYEMFGSQKNFRGAMEDVLHNYQNGGDPLNNPPPYHSWEVLLDRFNGDVNLAQKAACTINRVLGFTQTPYQEMTGLEVIKQQQNGRLNQSRNAALEDLQEEFYNPVEGSDSDKRKISLISKGNVALAKLYGESPNTIGLTPMRDYSTSIKTYRADRFVGSIIEAQSTNGNAMRVPWNMYSVKLGNINYSSNNWSQIDLWNNMADIQRNYDIGSTKNIISAWNHPSGYTVMEMLLPGPKKNGVNSRMQIFNPQNQEIDSTGVKGLDDAFIVAKAHAENNTQIPAKGNVVEHALSQIGWLPGSSVFAAKIRDTFVSTDGNWKIERNTKSSTGMYDLTDLRSGYILAKGIKIGLGKDGNPDVAGLQAAVKGLEDSGQVSIAMSKKFQSDIVGTHPRLPEYTIVKDADGGKSKAFFAAAPAYYEIKQRIAETIGFDKAEQITSKMRAELGDDVIKSDPNKIYDWMTNWHKEFTAEAAKQNLADKDPIAEKQQKDIQNATAIMDSIMQGEKLKSAIPNKPKNPGAKASQSDADAYKAEMIKYTEAQKAHAEYVSNLDWAGFDENALAGLGVWINSLKGQQDARTQLAAFARSNTDPVAGQESLGQQTLDNVSKIKNTIRETNMGTQSNWYFANSGLIIQEMLSKAPNNTVGTQYTHKRITVLGSEPEGVKDAKYIIYSLAGNVVAQAKSMEEANEIVIMNENPNIKLLSKMKGLRNIPKIATQSSAPTTPAPAQDTGNSKPKATIVAPAPNRYTTPAPR